MEFCFDIICPYAYLAANLVIKHPEQSVPVEWCPVLVGGLYDLSDAPQGKDGSASSVMSDAKKTVMYKDLRIQLARWDVPITRIPGSGGKQASSLFAMRVISAAPRNLRPKIAMALFHHYWVANGDLDAESVKSCCRAALPSTSAVLQALFIQAESDATKEKLRENTESAFKRGAFGVPTFFVHAVAPAPVPPLSDDSRSAASNDSTAVSMFFGADRFWLALSAAKRAVVGTKTVPAHDSTPANNVSRVVDVSGGLLFPAAVDIDRARRGRVPGPDGLLIPAFRHLVFFFDFSSPWAFLGWRSLAPLACRAASVTVVPVLLGAIFAAIGTPNVPLRAVSPAKQRYAASDLAAWCAVHNMTGMLRWNPHFPIRTVLPLRVAIVEPKLIDVLFTAAWQQEVNIGDPVELRKAIDAAGYDGAEIIARAEEPGPKADLRKNTESALRLGACGVPSYLVVDKPPQKGSAMMACLLWGQDHCGTVADILGGWNPPAASLVHLSPAPGASKL